MERTLAIKEPVSRTHDTAGRAGPAGRRSRILADRRGMTIVEFAIIAMPFFLLLAAVFEQAIIFYKHELLQTAVSASGRLILTGQASAAGYTQEQFRQQVCAKLPSFMQCSTISVDVRPYTSFTSARAFKPLDQNGNLDPTQLGYNAGAATSIIVVSAYSVQPVMFPNLNQFYSSAGNGHILIAAQAAFRNEPYS